MISPHTICNTRSHITVYDTFAQFCGHYALCPLISSSFCSSLLGMQQDDHSAHTAITASMPRVHHQDCTPITIPTRHVRFVLPLSIDAKSTLVYHLGSRHDGDNHVTTTNDAVPLSDRQQRSDPVLNAQYSLDGMRFVGATPNRRQYDGTNSVVSVARRKSTSPHGMEQHHVVSLAATRRRTPEIARWTAGCTPSSRMSLLLSSSSCTPPIASTPVPYFAWDHIMEADGSSSTNWHDTMSIGRHKDCAQSDDIWHGEQENDPIMKITGEANNVARAKRTIPSRSSMTSIQLIPHQFIKSKLAQLQEQTNVRHLIGHPVDVLLKSGKHLSGVFLSYGPPLAIMLPQNGNMIMIDRYDALLFPSATEDRRRIGADHNDTGIINNHHASAIMMRDFSMIDHPIFDLQVPSERQVPPQLLAPHVSSSSPCVMTTWKSPTLILPCDAVMEQQRDDPSAERSRGPQIEFHVPHHVHDFAISYIMSDWSWSASYHVFWDEQRSMVTSFFGRAQVHNRTDQNFFNVHLSLISGQVSREHTSISNGAPHVYMQQRSMTAAASFEQMGNYETEESQDTASVVRSGEHEEFVLPEHRTFDVLRDSVIMIDLIKASNIHAEIVYTYDLGDAEEERVMYTLEWENTGDQSLPKGVVHIYAAPVMSRPPPFANDTCHHRTIHHHLRNALLRTNRFDCLCEDDGDWQHQMGRSDHLHHDLIDHQHYTNQFSSHSSAVTSSSCPQRLLGQSALRSIVKPNGLVELNLGQTNFITARQVVHTETLEESPLSGPRRRKISIRARLHNHTGREVNIRARYTTYRRAYRILSAQLRTRQEIIMSGQQQQQAKVDDVEDSSHHDATTTVQPPLDDMMMDGDDSAPPTRINRNNASDLHHHDAVHVPYDQKQQWLRFLIYLEPYQERILDVVIEEQY